MLGRLTSRYLQARSHRRDKSAFKLRHVLPSVRLYVSVPLTLDGFPSNLILASSAENCRENPKLVKIDQNYWALYMKT
jgi:hypothetical protein